MSKRHWKRWNIPRARKRELLSFCREYKAWQKEKRNLQPGSARYIALSSNAALVRNTAREAGPFIFEWLFKAVTQGKPYTALWGIPCGPDYYYERRKKFLFLLDKKLREREESEAGSGEENMPVVRAGASGRVCLPEEACADTGVQGKAEGRWTECHQEHSQMDEDKP